MDSEYIVIEPQKSDEEDFQILESEGQEHQGPHLQSSLSVRLNECFVVVSVDEAHRQFHTNEEWNDFLYKTYAQRKLGMCIMDLNSIIGISTHDVHRRHQVWKAVCNELSSSAQGSIQSLVDAKIVGEVNQNIDKMLKKIDWMGEQELHFIKQLLLHVIVAYEAKENLLGSLKGLEYICYGLYIAAPDKQFNLISKAFEYIMEVQEVKTIFYSGSPLFYSELSLLESSLKVEAAKLYEKLDEHMQWPKIFIAYYKTLLMNRLKSEPLICKIFDLILVYGVPIVRMILLNIIVARQSLLHNCSDEQQLTRQLGTELLYDHLQLQLQKMMIQYESSCKQSDNLLNKKDEGIRKNIEDKYAMALLRQLFLGCPLKQQLHSIS